MNASIRYFDADLGVIDARANVERIAFSPCGLRIRNADAHLSGFLFILQFMTLSCREFTLFTNLRKVNDRRAVASKRYAVYPFPLWQTVPFGLVHRVAEVCADNLSVVVEPVGKICPGIIRLDCKAPFPRGKLLERTSLQMK